MLIFQFKIPAYDSKLSGHFFSAHMLLLLTSLESERTKIPYCD